MTQLTFDLNTTTTAKTKQKSVNNIKYKRKKHVQLVLDLGQKLKKYERAVSLEFLEEKTQLNRFYERFNYKDFQFKTTYDKRAYETYEDFENEKLVKHERQSKRIFEARIKERELRMKKMENSTDMFQYRDDIVFAATEEVEDDELYYATEYLMTLIMSSFIIDFNEDLKREWQVYERLTKIDELVANQDQIIKTMKLFGHDLKKYNRQLFNTAKNLLIDFYNRKFNELDKLCDIIYPGRKKERKTDDDCLKLAA